VKRGWRRRERYTLSLLGIFLGISFNLSTIFSSNCGRKRIFFASPTTGGIENGGKYWTIAERAYAGLSAATER
jgi:hypothetical protein